MGGNIDVTESSKREGGAKEAMNDSCLVFPSGPSREARNLEPGRNFLSVFLFPSISRTAPTARITLTQAHKESEMERRRSIRQKGWGGRVGWLWWWLIGQKGSVWVSSFVFLFFLALAPRSLLLITDGPPLTMPCYACEMQESNGRGEGVWGGMVWRGTYCTYFKYGHHTSTTQEKSRSHNNNNRLQPCNSASEEGCGARKEEERLPFE